MKAKIVSSLIFTVLTIVLIAPVHAKDWGEVELKSILMDASKFKNDRVTYTTTYDGFTTNAPLFLDKNGFKEGRDVVIKAGSGQFLVIAERKDFESQLLELKAGSQVKLTGKVKKMRNDPKRGIGTGHYLELERMELLKEPVREVAKAEFQKHKKGKKLLKQ